MTFLLGHKTFFLAGALAAAFGVFSIWMMYTARAAHDDEGDAFGFAWSSNAGWISFNSENDFGISIGASSDDAYHDPDSIFPGYSDTDASNGVFAGNPGLAGEATWGGWRWTELAIPEGAIIDEAYVRLRNSGFGADDIETRLAFEKNKVPPTFSSGNSPYHRRLNLTTQVSWKWMENLEGPFPSDGLVWARTPSMAAQLQEVVGLLGAGETLDAAVFIEDGTGVPADKKHSWTSYDGDRNKAAKLYISWTLGVESFSNIPPPAVAYKVQANPATGVLSGYAWSPNVGWISFDRAVTGAPPAVSGSDPPDADVCVDLGTECLARIDMTPDGDVCGGALYDVCGWARAISACQNDLWDGTKCTGDGAGDLAGGWDGWIKLRGGGGGSITGPLGTRMNDLVLEGSNMFVGGFRRLPTNQEWWRIEKRDKATLAGIAGFGVSGVLETDITGGDEFIGAMEFMDGWLYTGGTERRGNGNWRIERRDPSNAAITRLPDLADPDIDPESPLRQLKEGTLLDIATVDLGVGQKRMVAVGFKRYGGADTSWWMVGINDNPPGAPPKGLNQTVRFEQEYRPESGARNEALAVAIDTMHFYVAGMRKESAGGDDQIWHIEKRDITAGSPVWAVERPPHISLPVSRIPSDIIVQGGDLYIAGMDSEQNDWIIEKRSKFDGSLAWEKITTDDIGFNGATLTGSVRTPVVLKYDSGFLYVAGTENIAGVDKQWRIEKRDAGTGNLITAFDGDGVVTLDFGPGPDSIQDIEVDGGTNTLYVLGTEYIGVDFRWRLEKLDMTTGAGGPADYELVWNENTSQLEGWAWGSDVLGWIASNNASGAPVEHAVQIDLNAHPNAVMLLPEDLAGGVAYCSSNVARVKLRWDFTDPNPLDEQDAFQVVVRDVNDDDVVSLGTGVPGTVNSCPGQTSDVENPTGGTCNPGNTLGSYIPTLGNVLNVSHPLFNRTLDTGAAYYWAVRVKDNRGVWSKWSEWAPFDPPTAPTTADWPIEGRFHTIRHRAPEPSFEIVPQNPTIGEVVEFRDTSRCWCSRPDVIGLTNLEFACKDPAPATCDIGVYDPHYEWKLGVLVLCSGDTPPCRGDQERVFDNLLTGETMTLQVTEPTYGNFCSNQKSFNVHIPFPDWREISPF